MADIRDVGENLLPVKRPARRGLSPDARARIATATIGIAGATTAAAAAGLPAVLVLIAACAGGASFMLLRRPKS